MFDWINSKFLNSSLFEESKIVSETLYGVSSAGHDKTDIGSYHTAKGIN